MAVAQTLKEIALEKAKKRPELVDYLTEEAPILALLKWIPATHGLWNVEEVLDKITGASFTDLGAPLPTMQAETQLRQTYVSLMGGEIEVSKDKAAQFGGAKQYFARRENAFYRQAGMDTELAIWQGGPQGQAVHLLQGDGQHAFLHPRGAFRPGDQCGHL